ncbi:MAG: hypothetical protein EB060_10545 [Proteobacteria bacterium]|nr:hypothetical protein [Pseudomonadota bacterium]
MPFDTYVIGNDGNVTLPAGGTDSIKVKSYAATLSRVENEVTAFGDTGRRRRLGMLDLTGSLTGVPTINSTGSTNTALTNMLWMATVTQALTLTVFDGTGTTDARIAANCIFNNAAFSIDKAGDAALTVNFSNADGTAPVVTWLV